MTESSHMPPAEDPFERLQREAEQQRVADVLASMDRLAAWEPPVLVEYPAPKIDDENYDPYVVQEPLVAAGTELGPDDGRARALDAVGASKRHDGESHLIVQGVQDQKPITMIIKHTPIKLADGSDFIALTAGSSLADTDPLVPRNLNISPDNKQLLITGMQADKRHSHSPVHIEKMYLVPEATKPASADFHTHVRARRGGSLFRRKKTAEPTKIVVS